MTSLGALATVTPAAFALGWLLAGISRRRRMRRYRAALRRGGAA